MKLQRQSLIMDIISNENIETQEELLARLSQSGYNTTQATVSRDIKELRLVKTQSDTGRYKYTLPQEMSDNAFNPRLRAIFRESVTSFDAAQNIIVIKTLPGLASAACSAIDALGHADVVGTLAGDDTAFIAMRDNGAAQAFVSQIHSMLT